MCRCTKKYLELVHEILAVRLPLSRSWNNVSVVVEDIFSPTSLAFDPAGNLFFLSSREESPRDLRFDLMRITPQGTLENLGDLNNLAPIENLWVGLVSWRQNRQSCQGRAEGPSP